MGDFQYVERLWREIFSLEQREFLVPSEGAHTTGAIWGTSHLWGLESPLLTPWCPRDPLWVPVIYVFPGALSTVLVDQLSGSRGAQADWGITGTPAGYRAQNCR